MKIILHEQLDKKIELIAQIENEKQKREKVLKECEEMLLKLKEGEQLDR